MRRAAFKTLLKQVITARRMFVIYSTPKDLNHVWLYDTSGERRGELPGAVIACFLECEKSPFETNGKNCIFVSAHKQI